MDRTYIAIDLKSFYASVECIERGLDPMTSNLLVADVSRTDKTICLAVSPALKSYGVPGRPRLFEVRQKLREVNAYRKMNSPGNILTGSSTDDNELRRNPSLAVDFVIAPPQMSLYMKYSTEIYGVYLKYIAPEDIHVYSVDEVFIDATHYLKRYKSTPEELARMMILDVLKTTGITATAGIGTNLYLCKVAMDIVAKKIPADENGVRIAYLDEKSYREKLWDHRPLTDFWRVGKGYAKKLEQHGMFTMGDVARCSLGAEYSVHNEDLLYKLFGVNAELLIDHAWGWEPCTIADIKSYKPMSNSISSGQVLQMPYPFDKARIVVREMTDSLVMELVSKKLITNQLVLTIGYDIDNLKSDSVGFEYKGEVTVDHYGRKIPKHGHGTENIEYTSSSKIIIDAMLRLFDRITNPGLLVRRITVCANNVIFEKDAPVREAVQLDLFTDYSTLIKQEAEKEAFLKKEKSMQQAMLSIRERFGKNAVLKGTSLKEGATAKERNAQIGGHRA